MTLSNMIYGFLFLVAVVIAIVAYKKRKLVTILVFPAWVPGLAVGIAPIGGFNVIRESSYTSGVPYTPAVAEAAARALQIANLSAYVFAGLVLLILVFITVKKMWTPLRIAFALGFWIPSAMFIWALENF